MEQLQSVTGWLPHTIRGYLSGHMGKKLGRKVIRVKKQDSISVYRLEDTPAQ